VLYEKKKLRETENVWEVLMTRPLYRFGFPHQFPQW
jgi:hypothetical protein